MIPFDSARFLTTKSIANSTNTLMVGGQEDDDILTLTDVIASMEQHFGSTLNLDLTNELSPRELQRLVICVLQSHFSVLKRLEKAEAELSVLSANKHV